MVASKNFAHTATNNQIRLSKGGTNGGDTCTYVGIIDVSFMAVLCVPGCVSCVDADSCNICGKHADGSQLYFDSTLKSCGLRCTANYYSTVSPETYQCDLCHLSCLSCSVAASPTGCINCN